MNLTRESKTSLVSRINTQRDMFEQKDRELRSLQQREKESRETFATLTGQVEGLTKRLTGCEAALTEAREKNDKLKKDTESIIQNLRSAYERIGYLTMNRD